MSAATANAGPKPGMLDGLRVIEIADESAEYCGLMMMGLGAEVIKIEPSQGSDTRNIGPFYEDKPDPEGSLHFWAYNRGKKSVTLDLATATGQQSLVELLASADILLDSSNGQVNMALSLSRAQLEARFPRLVVARMTPFGDDGPWKDFHGSDLVHLALGGVMMNCGYDPDPTGHYDTPPIAPQVWHAYHIACEQLLIGILAALLDRQRTGQGQDVSCAIHEAVAKNTELDVMSWVMRRAPLNRQTCRHAVEVTSRVADITYTKDGRWLMTRAAGARDGSGLLPYLARYGMEADLVAPKKASGPKVRSIPGSTPKGEKEAHTLEIIQRFVRAYCYNNVPWKEAQAMDLLWAPLRKPDENALDEHWLARTTFRDIEHPRLGRSFRYPASKWLSTATAWQSGAHAPALGQHTDEILNSPPKQLAPIKLAATAVASAPRLTRDGKPFPLQGVRIFDFSWFLASAGGTRFLAALGAEVIKVEWKDSPDTRLAAMAPVGGRAARTVATAPLEGVTDFEMGGQFNNKNSGKRSLSLNIRHPKGLQIAKKLLAQSDIVAEGFSPGVLERLGFGYEVMKSIRPDIIYVHQSGTGTQGINGRLRTVGPVAAALAGTSDMSGLPEPAMPAGWGYSYLDWMGAYGFSQAILGALFHRNNTGEGQFIDSSQCEAGIGLTGVPTLDWSANGRSWKRFGNRSPYKAAAPHGAYRTSGTDRWIAVACFTEEHWGALTAAMGRPGLRSDPRFATLPARLQHQDLLDAEVSKWTAQQDGFNLMARLQAAGIPAGVCQTAEDRCDHDPQLRHLDWLTEVTGTRIGTWPVYGVPMKFSRAQGHIGGLHDRGAPNYGEDNDYVLGQLLGYSSDKIKYLAENEVI